MIVTGVGEGLSEDVFTLRPKYKRPMPQTLTGRALQAVCYKA